MHPMTQLDGCQVKLASVSAFANYCRQKSGLSGLVGVVSLCVIQCDVKGKRLVERRKRVPTGADTRLITPYTSYLLRGFP